MEPGPKDQEPTLLSFLNIAPHALELLCKLCCLLLQCLQLLRQMHEINKQQSGDGKATGKIGSERADYLLCQSIPVIL